MVIYVCGHTPEGAGAIRLSFLFALRYALQKGLLFFIIPKKSFLFLLPIGNSLCIMRLIVKKK